MEKANGDRDGEEELDEFELEKRAIGLKIKEAIESDETAEAVKALMAVAKEHELQCAAPRRRRDATPSRATAAPATRTLSAPSLHPSLHPLCTLSAPSAPPPCRCDDLFGFIFECVLDANAVKQVSTHKVAAACRQRPHSHSHVRTGTCTSTCLGGVTTWLASLPWPPRAPQASRAGPAPVTALEACPRLPPHPLPFQAVLAKLFKSSADKKKTQKFMLECVQKLVTDSPHASVPRRMLTPTLRTHAHPDPYSAPDPNS